MTQLELNCIEDALKKKATFDSWFLAMMLQIITRCISQQKEQYLLILVSIKKRPDKKENVSYSFHSHFAPTIQISCFTT